MVHSSRRPTGSSRPTRERRTRSRLVAELERLKAAYGYGRSLKVRYLPRGGSKRGEVVGGKVYVYDDGLSDAVETLRHEYLDHVLSSEIVQPLIDQINLLTSLVVKQVYRRKEHVIEKFSAKI